MPIGVYPGSFDPLTIAHLAIAEAGRDQLDLDRVDLAISRSTLGKEHLHDGTVERRVAAIEALTTDRPWLGVVVTDARLVADMARGYDAVIMGADKWAQVNDPAWYGGNEAERDSAVAALPRVAVAPRHDIPIPDDLRLVLPDHLAEVSSTSVRAGRTDWAAG